MHLTQRNLFHTFTAPTKTESQQAKLSKWSGPEHPVNGNEIFLRHSNQLNKGNTLNASQLHAGHINSGPTKPIITNSPKPTKRQLDC